MVNVEPEAYMIPPVILLNPLVPNCQSSLHVWRWNDGTDEKLKELNENVSLFKAVLLESLQLQS